MIVCPHCNTQHDMDDYTDVWTDKGQNDVFLFECPVCERPIALQMDFEPVFYVLKQVPKYLLERDS